ncbi:MAG: McrB family protein [bacterium]
MSRPDNMIEYPDVDLKLGIKSSLPNVKATLALLMMIWKSSGYPSEVAYSKAAGDSIEVSDEVGARLIQKYSPFYAAAGVSDDRFIQNVNGNQLFKSQLESLIVAFEQVWRIARIRFDGGMAAASERTGRNRYPKTLLFTINMDIIDSLLSSNEELYSKVLLSWIGLNIPQVESEYANSLLKLLVYISEAAVYKLTDNGHDIIFNMNNVYMKLAEEEGAAVNIEDSRETKGPLRILKSALSEEMNPFLSYNTRDGITVATTFADKLGSYQKRVDAYLGLTITKYVLTPEPGGIRPEETPVQTYSKIPRVTGGTNIILYGVPGAGKSHTIKHEYCDDDSLMERLVFHPDYTNSDFVGQILPIVSNGNVSYEFVEGPFTRLLKKAHENPGTHYFLIIEEINRGNAPAIFGEVFQLLDRTEDGTSEYGISNTDIAKTVYGDENHKVRLPSNITVIGTMNTSDQNVFTLDTAFQRRWHLRMIENDMDKAEPEFANHKILDTEVAWKRFNTVINNIILKKNVRITSSEDKRLGAYFVRKNDLIYNIAEKEAADPEEKLTAALENSRFPEKVLKYLWDDAFKFSRGDVFKTSDYTSLEGIVRKFRTSEGNERFTVFKEEVYYELVSQDAGNET